ncbi:P-loop containing nucleoside triphosphate hydrolase protein [Collybia nuda]|uniref:P-loop containing nucleoside triphosphate hydrolase protein n=1 Tax=Collybia nuda TaxID=64659 RepID=A0A9P5Y7W3_9AGAR|nr:P-loop containing nucleoside triphosphate hydrolase protein [Collybia nuda]
MLSKSSNKVSIAVMGLTGSGKSTFINLISGSDLPASGGLNSCTRDVGFGSPFQVDGREINLIDTPGFDDTNKNDAEILKVITDFLKEQFEAGITLHGVIYLYRISDIRMGGVSRRSFTALRNLCGDDNLKNVVIVTNMWGLVKQEDGEARETELKTNPTFFKVALERGAQIYRHDNTIASAEKIIRSVTKNHPRELSVQHEMVTLERALSDTTVGLQVKGELENYITSLRSEVEKLRKEHAEDEAAMNDLKAEVEEARSSIAQVKKQMIVLLGVERAWRSMPPEERVAMSVRLCVEGDKGRTAFWSLLGGRETIDFICGQLQKEFSKRPVPWEIKEKLLLPSPDEGSERLPAQKASELPPQFKDWIDKNGTVVETVDKVVKKHFPTRRRRSRWPRWNVV